MTDHTRRAVATCAVTAKTRALTRKPFAVAEVGHFAALANEPWDHTVKARPLVVPQDALLAGAERAKVLIQGSVTEW